MSSAVSSAATTGTTTTTTARTPLSSSDVFVIKVELDGDVRRFSLPSDNVAWERARHVLKLVLGARTQAASLVFEDEEGDHITVTNSAEFDDAVCVAREGGRKALRFLIQPSTTPAFRVEPTADAEAKLEEQPSHDASTFNTSEVNLSAPPSRPPTTTTPSTLLVAAAAPVARSTSGAAAVAAPSPVTGSTSSSLAPAVTDATAPPSAPPSVPQSEGAVGETKGSEQQVGASAAPAGRPPSVVKFGDTWVIVDTPAGHGRLPPAATPAPGPPKKRNEYVPKLLQSLFTPSSVQRVEAYEPVATRPAEGLPSYEDVIMRGDAAVRDNVQRTNSFTLNSEAERYVPAVVSSQATSATVATAPSLLTTDQLAQQAAVDAIHRSNSFGPSRSADNYVPAMARDTAASYVPVVARHS